MHISSSIITQACLNSVMGENRPMDRNLLLISPELWLDMKRESICLCCSSPCKKKKNICNISDQQPLTHLLPKGTLSSSPAGFRSTWNKENWSDLGTGADKGPTGTPGSTTYFRSTAFWTWVKVKLATSKLVTATNKQATQSLFWVSCFDKREKKIECIVNLSVNNLE